MTNKDITRRAFVTSVIALILCCSMLVGTTFAWFTDSVTSANNTITAGNLDVELYYKLKLTDAWQKVGSTTELFDDAALWEPGYTQVVYLKIANEGTLALDYKIGLNVVSETQAYNVDGDQFTLSKFIKFGTATADAETGLPTDRTAARNAVSSNVTTIYDGYAHPRYNEGNLEAKKETFLTLVAYMPETVDNEANYRGTAPSIKLGLSLVASQRVKEDDSFDNTYDQTAGMPQSGFGSAAAPTDGVSAVEVTVRNADTNAKIATVNVPVAAVADTTKPIEVSVEPIAQDPNVTVDADTQKAASFDVTVNNLKEGNTEPIKVELRVGTGLSGVRLFHNATEVTPIVYNEETGYVTFETTSFSPYTVVYDAEYKEEETTDDAMPVAGVTQFTADELAATEFDWTGFGGFNPKDQTQRLDCVFNFKAPHDSNTVANCAYKDWACDFYVSIENVPNNPEMLPEGVLCLGGNYGTFGWVGFNNPSVPVGQEIPLLGSVVTVDWTYESVVGFVGEFLCGVGLSNDHNISELDGAVFTVKLCLTNPETQERIAVNTIKYTFGSGDVVITEYEN